MPLPSAPAAPSSRRLAAVCFVDIVGYTHLSAQDENAALRTVQVFQEEIGEEVARYGGRLVKFLGDGAMAEFSSTDAAVRSALAFCRAFRSSTDSGDGGLLVRVGIHVGEVVSTSDGDIYGDGVNTASRLENEASPGQVLVSEDVWRQLRQQTEFTFRPVGERALRGIQGRVRLFEVGLAEFAAAPPAVDRRSIAVLPFTDISPGRDNEYFSDGISEELINAMSHIEGLRVASRTSSFSFKGKDLTVREIAEKLGVATILEGSVRKDGNRVRITPQLVDAENGYHLWSETYVSDMEDVFDVQEKISRAIVDALQVKLAGPADAPIVRRPTADLDAYNLYLRGRYHWNRHSGEDLKKSIECYESAIRMDSDYALAHAGLAHTYLTLAALFLPPGEAYPKARAAAHRALELNPGVAEAHAALAEVQMRYEWDWEAAERGFRRALQLDAGYGEGSRFYANYLRDMGRIDEAIVEIRRAQTLDPPSLPISAAVCGIYYFARRYDEAIREGRRILEEAPYFFQALFYLGFSYERKGLIDEALETFENMVTLSGIPSAIGALGHVHATAGHRRKAEEILDELLRRSEVQYVTPYSIARLYAALGELEKAFIWFDRALAERSNWLTSLRVEPALDPLRSDPRFSDLLAKVGLVEDIQPAPTNLPSPPTPMVGRSRELGEIRRILLDGTTRLLTLTGPGGTGKTRLGLEVARDVAGVLPDGVFFISMATVGDAGLLPAVIARTLNLSESGTDTPLEVLTGYLPGKRLLLVLDGFEQVREAAGAVSALLESTALAKVLVTSREPLHIRGEREYPVGPLSLPHPSAAPDPELLLDSEAIRLFLQRARAVKPSFELRPENAHDVLEICRRLDGLPLAIELAAAQAKHMSPQLMLARLADRFGFLTKGPRDVPEHQRTLRGAFDWSYDLLTEQEQTLFRRLSVFVGGFSLEAAEAVARPGGEREFHVLDVLASLVDKSLLREVESPDRDPRFEMLETIREYGHLLLDERGEIETVRRRHADHFLNLAQRAEPRLEGPDQAAWFDRLEAEHGNVQAALDWLLAQGQIETAVRLGTALWWFWWVRGHFGEMRWRMEQALDRSATLPKQLRANLLVASGALISLDGDHERAVKLFDEAVALERERHDKTGIPRALRGFGLLISDRGEYARASALFAEALVLDREFGNQHGQSADLRALGKMDLYQGNVTGAATCFEEALALDRDRGDRHSTAFSLVALGDAARYAGDADRADRMYQEALALFRELGSKPGVAYALLDLAGSAQLQGRLDLAASRYSEALDLLIHLGNKPRIADCVAGLAALAVARGRTRRAAELYGVVETMREHGGPVLSPPERAEYETHRAAALALLGEEEFGRALLTGRMLNQEQGIGLARQNTEDPASRSVL